MRCFCLLSLLLACVPLVAEPVVTESVVTESMLTGPLPHSPVDVHSDAPRLYMLPAPDEALIGELDTVTTEPDDTLVLLAHRHRVGYNALRSANPAVDAWLPAPATPVTLPNRKLLPMAERRGIVVNVSEMRLYYFLDADGDMPARVAVFPVSVGRGDWNTPLATSKIIRKAKDPNWYPPASIRAEHEADGDPLPAVVPGGPDNPLGRHALYLNLPGYLLHGSNKQFGIGMQVTHGCLRLYPEHIAYLYDHVPIGTPVRLVHQRIKLGWSGGALYLEVHPPLDGEIVSLQVDLELLTIKVSEFLRQHSEQHSDRVVDYPVNWERARLVVMEAAGVPQAIGPTLGVAADPQVDAGANPTG